MIGAIKAKPTNRACPEKPAQVAQTRFAAGPDGSMAVSNMASSFASDASTNYRLKMKFTWIGACTSTGCPLSSVGA